MQNLRLKVSIFINYFLFAILLNSVGIIILQVQHYFNVSAPAASVLEACKDLSIAIISFLVASFITRVGYKNSMLMALAAVAIGCFILPLVKTFLAIKILFAITGASFGLTKVSVYGVIGLVVKDEKEHISLMNFIESFFMIGILTTYFIFSYYISDTQPTSDKWFDVYYVLGTFSVIAFVLLLTSTIDESEAQPPENQSADRALLAMFKLIFFPLVFSFVACAFLYVLIEQSIMSWLPTFNNKVLNIPSSLSVLMASILAGSFALGRFAAGLVLKKLNWFVVLNICLVSAAILVIIALPLSKQVARQTITYWYQIPLIACVFPLIGFFLAPVYPAINSIILSSLPKRQHGTMAGLIVVFSALGGTLGSIITGFIFHSYGGETAFYFSLVPVGILIIALFLFKHTIESTKASTDFRVKKMLS